MFSSVQVALLFDLHSFSDTCNSERELTENVARIKLSCLRLLTEFGAQTEKGSEVVRWSYKYYDSRCYKPDTNRKSFQDFNRKSYDDFENDLTDRFYRAFDAKQGDGSAGGKSGAVQNQNIIHSSNVTRNKPHCYILNKSLQEVVHDYNWDRPDISSPVKSMRRRTQNKSKLIPEIVGPYNAVIVYTNVPKNQNELRKFCGEEGDIEGTADNFMDEILDLATRRYFQDEKQIRPYFINLINLSDTDDKNLFEGIRVGLTKLQGGLFNITSLVQTTPMCIIQNGADKAEAVSLPELFPLPSQPVIGAAHSLHSEWWSKGRPGRARKPQPGPSLIWEDSQGTSFLQAQLEVLAVQGSSSRAWSDAVVVGVVQLNAVSLVAVAGGMGSLYVCHAPNTVFTTLIQILAKYQLAMLLHLGCGGLALLCPWAGDVGCLAVVSSSGLAVPPLPNTNQHSDEILTHFASEIVKRCLGAAPAHTKDEPTPSDKRFDPQKTERWFCPERASMDTISKIQKKRTDRIGRKLMLERLQKKYRPQIPQPIGSREISSSSVMAPGMAPGMTTDMSHTAASTQVAPGKMLPGGKKLGISRAEQLMRNSRVVTAQQKFKDQRSEEEERAKASVRRAAQANEQQRKTSALASQTLNAVQDPQDTSQFVTSLISLRDGTEGQLEVPDMDLFTTAQTIMNLTLMHVKVAPGTNIESGLRKVLENGVLQNMQQINEIHSGPSKLRQYKLQSLLNLELLWVLGYSSSSKMEDESSEADNHSASVREELVEAAIKMLRAIMLHYNPTAMAQFLQETITENYCETLGEVLVEIYEELNQPLPENLAILTGNLMSVAPPSAKSNIQIGSVQSYDSGGIGSFENNPGSGKGIKRSTTNLQRHPSFKETKRQIVVPIAPRVLRRTVSEVLPKAKGPKQPEKPQGGKKSKAEVDHKKNKAEEDVRKVRRSLFDMDDAPKPKLQRSQTVSGASELRKSPRKKSRKPTATPKKQKGSSSSQESFKTPLKDTPTSETEWKTPKSKTGSSERVLVPETPFYKTGTNEFTKRRVRKSTGNTIITESPDVKRVCKTTPRRLRASLTISRRNSFYSGARSRNWEKGKSQLLADKIRGKYDRKSLDLSAIENINDVSFLFSEILSASQCDLSQDLEKDVSQDLEKDALPEKKILNFGLDDDNCENSEFSGFMSPAKNTRFASRSSANAESVTTPMKNIRRSLVMASPAKPPSRTALSPSKGVRSESLSAFESPSKNTRFSTSLESDVFSSPSKNTRSSLSTPVKEIIESPSKIRNVTRLSSEELILQQSPLKSRQNILLQSACMLSMTPSKRVQFTFNGTPSKYGSLGSNSPAPKSILKTPGKTPTKSPLKTPKKSLKMTPNKLIRNRVSQSPFKLLTKSPLRTHYMTTPNKVEFKTPTNSPHNKTPVKSPFRSPVIRNRVSQSPFKVSNKSPLRILMTTPTKVDFKTPTNSPHSKTPIKSPFRSPVIRNSLSQSQFKISNKSPLRTILMTTPTKVDFKTPTKSPHMKTPVKSPFRSPVVFFSSTKILQTPNKTPSKGESVNTDEAKMLLLSKVHTNDLSDLVPETPNKTNENLTKLDTLPLIDREMELSSPVKGSQSRSTASIVLHNTPTKGQQAIQRDLFSLDSTDIPVGPIATVLPNPVLCEASEQEDVDGSTNLPDIAAEDIEFVNSIMFGSNFDPDSGLGITVSSDEDEEIYKQRLNSMLNSLSSPVKGSGHNTQEVVMGFEKEVSLGLSDNCATPVKLNSLLNDYMEEVKTPGKEFRLNVPETIDSPEISLDPKIRKYLEKMKRENSLTSKEEELCNAEKFIPKAEGNDKNNAKRRGRPRKSVVIEAQNTSVNPSTSLVSLTNTLVNNDIEKVDENKFMPKGEGNNKNNEKRRGRPRKSVVIEAQNTSVNPSTSLVSITNTVVNNDIERVDENNSLDKKSNRKRTSLENEKKVMDKVVRVQLEAITPDETMHKFAKRKLLTEDEPEEENETKLCNSNKKNSIENETIEITKRKRISNENNTASKNNANASKIKSKRLSNESKIIALAENSQKNEEDVFNESNDKVQKYMDRVNLQASMLFSSEDYDKVIMKAGKQNVIIDSNVNRRDSNDDGKTSPCKGNKVQKTSRRLSLDKNNLSVKKETAEDDDELFLKRSLPKIKKKKRIFDSDSDTSPVKSPDAESMPLKNVENVFPNTIEKQEYAEKFENSDSIVKEESTPDRRHKQQKIDVYLSPGHKPSGIETTPTRGTIDSVSRRKRSVTPLDDWKRVKPLRGMKLHTDKSEIEIDEKLDFTTISKTEGKGSSKNKKKRKNDLKLKIAKTSEGYKATTNASLEGSDLNSSTEQNQKENLNGSTSTENNTITPKIKKKKNRDYERISFLTPHRFTRGISKDLHVTPDDFQKLITLSPVKNRDESKSAKRLSDEFLGVKIEEELSRKSNQMGTNFRSNILSADMEDLPMPTPPSDKTSSTIHSLSDLPMPTPSPDKLSHQNSQNTELDGLPMPSPDKLSLEKVSPLKNIKDDIWTVTSVPGSPTMSKFIRKEKRKNYICKTPRIQLSPVNINDTQKAHAISSPSIQSILHLASSPIIKTKSEINESSNSKKSRRLSKSKNRLSSVKFNKISEYPNCDRKHGAGDTTKVYKTYEEKILEEVAQLDKNFKTRRKSSTFSVDSEVSLKNPRLESTDYPVSPIFKKRKSRKSTISSHEEAIAEDYESPPKSRRSRANHPEFINASFMDSDDEVWQVLPVTPKSYKTYEDRIMDEVKQLSDTPRSTRPSKNYKDVSSPEEEESFENVKKPRTSNVSRATKRKLERDLPDAVNKNIEFDSSHCNQTYNSSTVEPDENEMEPSRPSRTCKTPMGVCYISPVSPDEHYYPRKKSRTGRRLSRPNFCVWD